MSRKHILVSTMVVAAVAVLAIHLAAGGSGDSAFAQAYGPGLTVGGQPVGGSQPANVTEPQPVLKGSATAGATVAIVINPGNLQFTATAGSDGVFQVRAPSTLAPGTYTVTVNGQVAGSFKVAEAPKPPATGTGLAITPGGGVQIALFLAAAGVIVLSIGRHLRKRQSR